MSTSALPSGPSPGMCRLHWHSLPSTTSTSQLYKPSSSCVPIFYIQFVRVSVHTFCVHFYSTHICAQLDLCARLCTNIFCSHKVTVVRATRHFVCAIARSMCATPVVKSGFVCAVTHFVRATLILCAGIFAPFGPPYICGIATRRNKRGRV